MAESKSDVARRCSELIAWLTARPVLTSQERVLLLRLSGVHAEIAGNGSAGVG
jgi:hypothetical protein